MTDISNLEKIDFNDCLNSLWSNKELINEVCGKKIGKNKYIVQEGKALRTKARLYTTPCLDESSLYCDRDIEMDCLLFPGTVFSLKGRGDYAYERYIVTSNSLYPERMKYADKRWHDKFFKSAPTKGYGYGSFYSEPHKYELNKHYQGLYDKDCRACFSTHTTGYDDIYTHVYWDPKL